MVVALKCIDARKSFKTDKSNGLQSLFFKKNKRDKVPVIKGINFHIDEGEIFGILGPNGSGKSTLVRMIATLLYPDEGVIEVFGHNVEGERLKVRRLINRVSVEASFFKKLSAAENLSFAARLYGLSPKESRPRIEEILDRLGFPSARISSPIEHLSRGMQQKVAIARALMTRPVLLLLDEPTTGLDPKSKRDVQDFLFYINRTYNTTILLTTHDMVEAERLCQRLALIDDGLFVALDTPENLKESIKGTNGHQEVTMEDVFMALTGKGLEGVN